MPCAIITVSNKNGLEEFARLGSKWAIYSSGGTYRRLVELGILCEPVESITGMREMMDGRLKTLDKHIFGGILAERDKPDHMDALHYQLESMPIDLVAVNFYPFLEKPCIENIDIGGPALVRAAAKNHAHVAVVVDPSDYTEVTYALSERGEVPHQTRERLICKAFAYTAAYDAAIAAWCAKQYAHHGSDKWARIAQSLEGMYNYLNTNPR